MTRAPLRTSLLVEAVWISRFWTTDPPVYVAHTEWSTQINVSSELPLRVAAITSDPAGN